MLALISFRFLYPANDDCVLFASSGGMTCSISCPPNPNAGGASGGTGGMLALISFGFLYPTNDDCVFFASSGEITCSINCPPDPDAGGAGGAGGGTGMAPNWAPDS